MPSFTAYNVDVDLDIDVDDFLSECSSREIKELINALIEDGHLAKHPLLPGHEGNECCNGVYFSGCLQPGPCSLLRVSIGSAGCKGLSVR